MDKFMYAAIIIILILFSFLVGSITMKIYIKNGHLEEYGYSYEQQEPETTCFNNPNYGCYNGGEGWKICDEREQICFEEASA